MCLSLDNLLLSTSLEDHSTDLLEKIRNLFQETVLTDVTLVCEDHTKLEAHQVILGAVSSIFREMLSRNTHSHPLIFLRGVQRNELQSLLDFIYNGETSIQQDSLEDFMKIGKTFEVAGLGNTNKEKLKKEMEEVRIDETETMIFPCEFCDFKTHDIDLLNQHNVLKHPSTESEDYHEANRKGNATEVEQILSCVLCPYVGNSKKDLKFHNQIVHLKFSQEEGQGRFICNICGNSYSKEGNLKLHQKVKHDSGRQRLKCDFCDLTYSGQFERTYTDPARENC